jgi:hypothetical protein
MGPLRSTTTCVEIGHAACVRSVKCFSLRFSAGGGPTIPSSVLRACELQKLTQFTAWALAVLASTFQLQAHLYSASGSGPFAMTSDSYRNDPIN